MCYVEVREPPQGPDFAFHRVEDNCLLFAAVYMGIAACLAHEHLGIPSTVSPLYGCSVGITEDALWCSALPGC